MQKAPGQSDQGQIDLKRGPWGYGGPCMLRYRSRAAEVPLGSQKMREEAQTARATQKAGPGSAAGDVRHAVQKAPDLGGQWQTRGGSHWLGGSQAAISNIRAKLDDGAAGFRRQIQLASEDWLGLFLGSETSGWNSGAR